MVEQNTVKLPHLRISHVIISNMPIVRIDFEKNIISQDEIKMVAVAIQEFTAKVTKYDLKDISVFASENQVTINAAPVEIYVYATFERASDEDLELMLKEIRDLIVPFKLKNNIKTLFNLSIVKMNWKFELEV